MYVKVKFFVNPILPTLKKYIQISADKIAAILT